jgi:hypothetical protein
MSRTNAAFQNVVTTEPFVKMSRMSNQRKAEFVGDIFSYAKFLERSWQNFAENLCYTGTYDLPEILN